VVTSYERVPALVLGLVALLAVPPLAILGLMLRARDRASGEQTQIQPRKRGATAAPRNARTVLTEGGPSWPSEAWIEIEGAGQARHGVGRSVVRIGREGDNDICLADKTVHRYHAAVHRTDDAEFVITDLSSAGGNGIKVNGRAVAEARLADGDTIDLGLARLKFIARPA
jgi:hypothetical protein